MSDSAQNVDVIILGGGLCGLYAGITACREGKSVLLLEKEDHLGGLAAGFKFGENFCDFGVHMLHAFNKEVFEDCAAILGEERIEVALDARIQWGNTLCRYPLKFTDMLGAMSPITLFRCVAGLLLAEVSGAKKSAQIETAEDALVAYYGSPLYEFFFEEFTHKYWGIHPEELSAEFVRRKMPRLSAVDMLRKLFPFLSKNKEGLVESALDHETLHYSRNGAEALPRCLEAEFRRLGGSVVTGVKVEAMSRKDGRVHVKTPLSTYSAANFLNTAPLHAFVQVCDFADETIQQAARQLTYKPTVVDALLVKKESCIESLYTYYRNRRFHRVGEPKNAGMQVRPEGYTVLIVEATCEVGDDAWEGNEAYWEQIKKDLEAEGICLGEEVVDRLHLKNAHGYPVYNLGFEKHLEAIHAWLEEYPEMKSTGRQGGFTYPAMHTAMQMGKTAIEDWANDAP